MNAAGFWHFRVVELSRGNYSLGFSFSGVDVLILGKILQQTAYVLLRHNQYKQAAVIADHIFSKLPDALTLHSEAMLIDLQCDDKASKTYRRHWGLRLLLIPQRRTLC